MMLKKYEDELYKCVLCDICREMYFGRKETFKVCPTREELGFESYSAKGKILIARALLKGQLKYNNRLVERLYKGCLLCAHCKNVCPLGVDTISIFKAMRQDIVRKKLGPVKPLKQMDKEVDEKFNVFGEAPAERSKWAEGLNLPKKGETLYFAGCRQSYRYLDAGRSLVAILKNAGINVAYLAEDEWCCGAPQIADGSIAIAEKMLRHNVDAFKASGAKRIVTSCAGCYHVLKTEYAEILEGLPFEVLHSSELINDLMEKGKIKMAKEIKKRITYHDPCHLGRYEGVYDPPRKILESVPGFEVVEMLRNRENAWCCGGGATEYAAFPELASRIAKTRVDEAKDIMAEAIITSCPLCISILTPVAKKAKIKVYDLPVIIAEMMELKV